MRKRIGWDDYFMIEALWAKVRSPDMSTQHGCIIVNKDKHPTGQGYNGYPRGVDDNKMPKTRPEKYPPILHADENAILNSDHSLKDATMYITGPPCVHCWAQIIQSGITRVVYGPIKSTSPQSKHIKDDPNNQLIQDMLENQIIEVVEWLPKKPGLILDELEGIIEIIKQVCIDQVLDENDELLARLAE